MPVLPAEVFAASTIKAWRSILDSVGVTTCIPKDLAPLLADGKLAEAAEEFALLLGTPIFLEPEKGPDGGLLLNKDDGDRILMSSGVRSQRWQAYLEPPQSPSEGEGDAEEHAQELGAVERAQVLYDKLKPLSAVGANWLNKLARSQTEVTKVTVLVNRAGGPDAPPVPAQCLHTDLGAGVVGMAGFMPLVPCDVLVAPFSQHTIMAHEAVMGVSSIAASALAALAVPKHRLVRLQMKPGQIVAVQGNVVHAGSDGVAGEAWPRIHFYVTRKETDNETHPLVENNPLFTAMF
jgi:hypothetical protein